MANSFLRDMFELQMGEFRNKYGATVSGPDYARMKAAASGVSHSTVLRMGVVNSPTSGVSLEGLGPYVITRLYVKVYGTTALLEVAITPPLWADFLLSGETGKHSEIDVRDVEWTPETIVLTLTGTGSFYYEVHGYKPPLTNP